MKSIDHILSKLSDMLILMYQYSLSPDKWVFKRRLAWKICSHEPHCSAYARQHLQYHWFFSSVIPILRRVYHCRPRMTKLYDPAILRVIFRSSAQIGIEFLNILQNNPYTMVVGIVTQPDKPAWRWNTTQETVIKSYARENNIPYITPQKINPDKSHEWKETYEWLKNLDADCFVVIAYGKIIPQSILDIPKIWPINVHWSLLPAYRWASPLQSVFLDWWVSTGLTIMLMDSWLDTWDILTTQSIDIDFDNTVVDLIHKTTEIWPILLYDTLIWYAQGTILPYPQVWNISHTRQFVKEDGKIYLWDTLESVYNKYRAFALWPKIRYIDNHRYIIEKLVIDQILRHDTKNLSFYDKTRNLAILNLEIKKEWEKSKKII